MRIAICALIYIRFGVFYMSLKMTYYNKNYLKASIDDKDVYL